MALDSELKTLKSRSSFETVCRICYNNTAVPLVSPCNCKGSIGFVHKVCLEQWLAESNTDYCEVCRFSYVTQRTCRYNIGRSLWVWLKTEPNIQLPNQDVVPRHLRGELAIFAVLTPVMFFADFYARTKAPNSATTWTTFSLWTVAVIINVGFYLWMLFAVKYFYELWFSWWQSENVVQVILPESVSGVVSDLRVTDQHNVGITPAGNDGRMGPEVLRNAQTFQVSIPRVIQSDVNVATDGEVRLDGTVLAEWERPSEEIQVIMGRSVLDASEIN